MGVREGDHDRGGVCLFLLVLVRPHSPFHTGKTWNIDRNGLMSNSALWDSSVPVTSSTPPVTLFAFDDILFDVAVL